MSIPKVRLQEVRLDISRLDTSRSDLSSRASLKDAQLHVRVCRRKEVEVSYAIPGRHMTIIIMTVIAFMLSIS